MVPEHAAGTHAELLIRVNMTMKTVLAMYVVPPNEYPCYWITQTGRIIRNRAGFIESVKILHNGEDLSPPKQDADAKDNDFDVDDIVNKMKAAYSLFQGVSGAKHKTRAKPKSVWQEVADSLINVIDEIVSDDKTPEYPVGTVVIKDGYTYRQKSLGVWVDNVDHVTPTSKIFPVDDVLRVGTNPW